MTGHEALKSIYEFAKENSDKLDAKTIFSLGEAVGTISRIIEEKSENKAQQKEIEDPKMVRIVYDVAYCPKCDHAFEVGSESWYSDFCPHCGLKLKWES